MLCCTKKDKKKVSLVFNKLKKRQNKIIRVMVIINLKYLKKIFAFKKKDSTFNKI